MGSTEPMSLQSNCANDQDCGFWPIQKNHPDLLTYPLAEQVCFPVTTLSPVRDGFSGNGIRSVAQPGSASGLGPEGREFESLRSDHRSALKRV